MYNLIYRIRKQGGVNINIRSRTIYYEYNDDVQTVKMRSDLICKLCNEFGFTRQAVIPC